MMPSDKMKRRLNASATTCSHCGHTVAPSAWKCENCGSQTPTPNQWGPKLIIAAIGFGFLIAFLS